MRYTWQYGCVCIASCAKSARKASLHQLSYLKPHLRCNACTKKVNLVCVPVGKNYSALRLLSPRTPVQDLTPWTTTTQPQQCHWWRYCALYNECSRCIAVRVDGCSVVPATSATTIPKITSLCVHTGLGRASWLVANLT